MPFRIVRDDITHAQTDAIVVAANEDLRPGGGVSAAIFSAAGPKRLGLACKRIGHCDVGKAVHTRAYRLVAKHLIHTVGPKWRGGTFGEEELLRSCYRESLMLADSLKDTSIAFPLLSSGAYHYPKDAATEIAIEEISRFLDDHEMDVTLYVFDEGSLMAADARAEVASFIDASYIADYPFMRRSRWETGDREGPVYESHVAEAPAADQDRLSSPTMAPLEAASRPHRLGLPKFGGHRREDASTISSRDAEASAAYPAASIAAPTGLDDLLKSLDAGFSDTLMRLIDERDLKDSVVYKRANMSRQHFSKIRSNSNYQPKKHTVLALAVALELDVDETKDLLSRAGFALTHADKRDVIVEYYLNRHVFDINRINLTLFDYDQPLLG